MEKMSSHEKPELRLKQIKHPNTVDSLYRDLKAMDYGCGPSL